MRAILLFVVPLAVLGIALGVAAAAAKKGKNVFKMQGVAWLITIVMVAASIGIGYGKAHAFNVPDRPDTPNAPSAAESYVWDNAHVLSSVEIRELDQRNQRLWANHSVTIGVVTCNYGGEDLGEYAMQCAEDMGLGGYDMIVVLDISGKNYWLLQGNDIRQDFTDKDCTDYAWEYMEYDFARGFYGDAVLGLTEILEGWYGTYFD